MDLKIDMSFDYGKKHYSSGVVKNVDVAVAQHAHRFGFGEVIRESSKPISKPIEVVKTVSNKVSDVSNKVSKPKQRGRKRIK